MENESEQHSEKVISSNQEQLQTLWDGYTKALEIWINSYQQWQKAGEEALKMYAMGIEMATKSANIEQMKKYNELWENAWKQSGQDRPFSWYTKAWEQVWKESGFVNIKSFVDYWENLWQNTTGQAFENSVEAVKKLNEKWDDTSRE